MAAHHAQVSMQPMTWETTADQVLSPDDSAAILRCSTKLDPSSSQVPAATLQRKDEEVVQRQASAAQRRDERELRLRDIRSSNKRAQEDKRQATRRRQLALQHCRREEDDQLLSFQRQAAFESLLRTDPERLLGVRACIDGCEGTIESWHACQSGWAGSWQILLDNGSEELLTTILLEQLVDVTEFIGGLENQTSRGGSRCSSSPGSLPLETLKGVRLHVDGMGPGVVSNFLGVNRVKSILELLLCAGSKTPTHSVLFDDGSVKAVNLDNRGTTYWVLDDLDNVSEDIGSPDRTLEHNQARESIEHCPDSAPPQLREVMDAVQRALKLCHDASGSHEEMQKARPRLDALDAGLHHTKAVLAEFPAAEEVAKPFLDDIMDCLHRVSSLAGCQHTGRRQIVRPQDIGAELRLALEDLERARWDLVFQLNLETNRGALEAAAARASLSKHHIDACDIVFGPVLGQGGFASVFLCDWQGAKTAAKCFDLRNLSVRQRGHLNRSFHRETEVAFNLRSPRVLQVFGVCTSVSDRLYIIMELAVGGSVRAKLDAASESLPVVQLWGLARDTALGMRYLHDQKIVHRDLKSHNVLLDAHGSAKVADFGIARAAGELQKMSSGSDPRALVGTVAWMAPEALHGEASFASDVFSFGVFLWELATLQMPWHGQGLATIIYKVCCKHDRLPTDSIPNNGQHAAVRQVLSQCWEHCEDSRPSFEILEEDMLLKCKKAGLRLSTWRSPQAASTPAAPAKAMTDGDSYYRSPRPSEAAACSPSSPTEGSAAGLESQAEDLLTTVDWMAEDGRGLSEAEDLTSWPDELRKQQQRNVHVEVPALCSEAPEMNSPSFAHAVGGQCGLSPVTLRSPVPSSEKPPVEVPVLGIELQSPVLAPQVALIEVPVVVVKPLPPVPEWTYHPTAAASVTLASPPRKGSSMVLPMNALPSSASPPRKRSIEVPVHTVAGMPSSSCPGHLPTARICKGELQVEEGAQPRPWKLSELRATSPKRSQAVLPSSGTSTPTGPPPRRPTVTFSPVSNAGVAAAPPLRKPGESANGCPIIDVTGLKNVVGCPGPSRRPPPVGNVATPLVPGAHDGGPPEKAAMPTTNVNECVAIPKLRQHVGAAPGMRHRMLGAPPSSSAPLVKTPVGSFT